MRQNAFGLIQEYCTRTELNGFFGGFSEAQMRDARSASQWFPPESARESAKNESEFGAQARRVFSPRNRFEPKISLALLLDQAPYLIDEVVTDEETAKGYRKLIEKFIQNK